MIHIAAAVFSHGPPDQVARFIAKLSKPNACWLWKGAVGCRGYGLFWIDGKRCYAHRVAYRWAHGVDAPETVDHVCKTRRCVNPAHLQAATLVENVMRGLAPPARNARKTHCIHGHEFSLENTGHASSGRRRRCKTCAAEWNRRHSRKPYTFHTP